jgi:ParB family transcriptional regulator, chromosome partitioning protein
LKAEYDRLGAEYAKPADDSEETEARLEELGNELDILNDRPYVFDPQDVARGGAFISLAANGEPKIERSFVRPEDEPDAELGSSKSDEGDHYGQDETGVAVPPANGGISLNGKPVGVEEPKDDDNIGPLSDRVIEDLTATRTVALRNALANDPVMTFIAALHVAVLKIFYRYGADSCLEIILQHTVFSQTQGLGDTVWAKEIEQRQKSCGL